MNRTKKVRCVQLAGLLLAAVHVTGTASSSLNRLLQSLQGQFVSFIAQLVAALDAPQMKHTSSSCS